MPTRGYRFVAPVREIRPDPSAPARPRPWRALLAAGLAAGALVAAFLLWHWSRSEPPANQVVRFELTSTPLDDITTPAVSPDGTRVVYSAREGAQRQLHLRALNGLHATPLPGTGGADYAFLSPDGRAIGLFINGTLTTIDLETNRSRGSATTSATSPGS